MTPWQWMTTPLRKYAQFSGRAPRAEFWWFALLGLVVSVVGAGVDAAIGSEPGKGIAGNGASIALAVPQLAVSVRRLHDIGRSGWWVALPMVFAVPLVLLAFDAMSGGGLGTGFWALLALTAAASLLLLVWDCTRGTPGPNRFGDDPLAP